MAEYEKKFEERVLLRGIYTIKGMTKGVGDSLRWYQLSVGVKRKYGVIKGDKEKILGALDGLSDGEYTVMVVPETKMTLDEYLEDLREASKIQSFELPEIPRRTNRWRIETREDLSRGEKVVKDLPKYLEKKEKQ